MAGVLYAPFDGTVLTKDADINVYIYDITGRLIWRRMFPAGTNGGKAGYNEVYFSGMNDFSEILGNGMYFIRIVNGKKSLGTLKIVVLE